MKLIEQKYKNLNRRYFRGHRDDWSEKNAVFNEMYYTTSLEYAFFYAIKHKNGTITEYRLNKDADIFNLKSKKDYFTLLKYIKENDNDLRIAERGLDALKKEDWLFFFRDYDRRNELLGIIKSLGYDGYFNYEFDTEYVEDAFEYDLTDIPLSPNNPSIGAFNNNIFKKIRTWTLDEVRNSEIFEKFRQKEIYLIRKHYKEGLKSQLRRNNSVNKEDTYIDCLNYINYLLFLSEDDFYKMLDELDKEWTKDKIAELPKEIEQDKARFLSKAERRRKERFFEKILKKN